MDEFEKLYAKWFRRDIKIYNRQMIEWLVMSHELTLYDSKIDCLKYANERFNSLIKSLIGEAMIRFEI